LTGALLTPQGAALASQFLAQFRSEQLAVVEVSPQSQQAIQQTFQTLSNLGTVEYPQGMPSRGAARAASQASVSLQEASQRVGFQVTELAPGDVPAGLQPTPRVSVFPGGTIRFRFDAAKARAYYQAHGQNVNVPAKFDGAALVVNMPAAALLSYQAADPNSHQELVLGEAGEVTVGTDGHVSLDEMRAFLLDLPGLPADTVAQLKAIKDWHTTLPIPVPVDKVQWQARAIETKGGKSYQGLLLNDNSGVGSAAIVQANGRIYGWAGSMKARDLLDVIKRTDVGAR
jgi:hypothetical protein